MERKEYDHEILLLQGGGALGAYQAGVYEGLVEAGVAPTWVVGISIGAINASLIVGNPPERRVERLREFWQRVSRDVGPPLPAWLDSLRPAVNYMAAMSAATFGIRAFFTPRMPPASFAADGTEGALSVYDTTPLKATLEELVDFDLINSGQVRLSLGAVDVRKGTSMYFDTKSTRIHSDHVRASGALPPGFPPVTIDGEHYWDGGVVSNTPITYVSDERPLTTARIIQVDVFNSQGELNDAGGGQRSFIRNIGDWRIANHTAVPVVFSVDRHRWEAGWQSATGSDMVRVDKSRLRIEIDEVPLRTSTAPNERRTCPRIDQIEIHQLF